MKTVGTLTSLVLNRILSSLNLEWSPYGLFYIHSLRYGKIKYFITKDFEKVCNFLQLPYIPDDNEEEIYYSVTNSPYFIRKVFFNKTIENKRFEKFLTLLKKDSPVDLHTRVFLVNYGAIMVDEYFHTSIVDKIKLNIDKGISNKAIKSRFNGHLVMKWTNVSKGPIVKEIIEEFKQYIEDTHNTAFLNYLCNHPPKFIRQEFINFYNLTELDIDNFPY